ncbi:MAG: hypothetical protein KAS86_04175, partial [Candidatus Omnitrophica bacterium]|nr:hypothetical protein [Candidatus Omnitrophota bacterium]
MNIAHLGHRRIWLKILSTVMVCLFFMNTIAGALPQRIFPVSRTVLQVQSMFKPILDVTGKEYETQLRIETAV